MAALDFPSSPTNGQLYPNPAVSGQPQYTYDGEKWTGGAGVGNVYISDSPPAAPAGSLWFESDTGMLYVRYNDGDSLQWVAIPGGPSDAVRYGVQTLTSAQRSQARANIDVTKKNYVINGAMQISQENGTTAVTNVGGYPVDMFVLSHAGITGVISVAQVLAASPAGSTHRLRATVTTADAAVAAGDVVQIMHHIEGLRAADLQFGLTTAKTITVQFGVKAPAGTYSFVVSGAADRGYVAEYVIAVGEANTDVVKSITIPGDTTGAWARGNVSGILIRWSLMCGTTYQQAAGSWAANANSAASPNQFNFMGTNGNTFELFDVSLTEGTVAPPFQVPDYASELALCQRYWGKSYRYDQAPGTIATDNQIAYISNSNHGEWGPTISYTVEMRGLPTYVVYSPQTGASSKRRNLSTGVDETMTGFNIPGTKSHSGANAGHASGTQVYAYHFTRNARL